jgi:hypothetical protein
MESLTEPLPIPALADVPQASAGLPQHAVTPAVAERAARMFNPGGYEITGYVLTQKISSWKAIVDVTGVRWMSLADLEGLMAWKEPTGDGAPPASQDVSEEPMVAATTSATNVSEPPVLPPVRRAALTRQASHEPLSEADEAMEVLARRLGCVFNDTIEHNAGWFVPGNPVSYASPLDAIEALVAHLKDGGTTYHPRSEPDASAVAVTVDRVAMQPGRAAPDTQQALF